jgi:hypothetical protein
MKAIEIFGNQKIDVRKVETTPAYTRPPWLVEENETIDLTMCAILKGASTERIKAEFTSLMADKYEEYVQIYTDGSLKDDKVGFAIVTNNQIIKKRRRSQSSIYSAEQQAIITAMENTIRTKKPTIIATDSLSALLAAFGNRWTRNPKRGIAGDQ